MKIYAKDILLANGWATNKTLILENGVITQIEDGQISGAQSVSGPVVPGMVNLHSHAFQKAFVGLTEFQANPEDSFWSWRDAMYKLLKCITPDDLNTIANYLYIEMLLQGYTSVAEFHYLHHQPGGAEYSDPSINSKMIIEAARSSGIALCHCPVFYSYANFGEAPPSDAQRTFVHTEEEFVSLLDELHRCYTADDNVQFGIAPHSLRAVSESQLKSLTAWWQEHEASGPIHIHIAEQQKEVQESVGFYGHRPVEWLYQSVDVDERWCLVHATHLTEQETRLMAESKAIAGICPQTEANLGDGIFNGVEYKNLSGRFGIGSDSHIAISPWNELRTYEYSQRLKHQRRNLLCTASHTHVGEYLWTQAAQGGAQVVNRNTGVLAVGKRADLLVLDTTVPELNSVKSQQLLDAAIFASNENPVKDVMVNGKWVIENKTHAEYQSAKMAYMKFLKDKVSI